MIHHKTLNILAFLHSCIRPRNLGVTINPLSHHYLIYFHCFFLMFHYCSCLISVLVSMERGYRRIVHLYPNSKITATKTCYSYGTKSCDLCIQIWLLHQSAFQPAIACPKLTIETLEQAVKYVPS